MFSKVSQFALDRLLKCPCYRETWEIGGRYIDIFKERKLSEARILHEFNELQRMFSSLKDEP